MTTAPHPTDEQIIAYVREKRWVELPPRLGGGKLVRFASPTDSPVRILFPGMFQVTIIALVEQRDEQEVTADILALAARTAEAQSYHEARAVSFWLETQCKAALLRKDTHTVHSLMAMRAHLASLFPMPPGGEPLPATVTLPCFQAAPQKPGPTG